MHRDTHLPRPQEALSTGMRWDAARSQPAPFCMKPLVFRGPRSGEMGGGSRAPLPVVEVLMVAVWCSLGVSGSLDQRSHPLLHQSRDLQALGRQFPRTPSEVLWSSSSRPGLVDGLGLRQTTHSREIAAGVHVLKEPGCSLLCPVRHGPWAVSPR